MFLPRYILCVLYAYNAVGSVVANTDQDGFVIRENDFDAYGNQVREQDWTSDNFPIEFGGSSNDLLFSTKERDFSTGLDYFGFRYYDAVLGKFTTRDPSGYPDGPNNYLYCSNNPINKIDPLGLEGKDWLDHTFDFLKNNNPIYMYNKGLSEGYRQVFGDNWVSDASDDVNNHVMDAPKNLARATIDEALKGGYATKIYRDAYQTFNDAETLMGENGGDKLLEQKAPRIHQLIHSKNLSNRESRKNITTLGVDIVSALYGGVKSYKNYTKVTGVDAGLPNQKVIRDMQKQYPNASNGEILNKLKGTFKTLEVPVGFSKITYAAAQKFISDFLKANGLEGSSGFATGSRVTGVSTSPKKLGKLSTSKSDFDITVFHDKKLTKLKQKTLVEKMKEQFQEKFGIDLGVKLKDIKQKEYIPDYGQKELEL